MKWPKRVKCPKLEKQTVFDKIGEAIGDFAYGIGELVEQGRKFIWNGIENTIDDTKKLFDKIDINFPKITLPKISFKRIIDCIKCQAENTQDKLGQTINLVGVDATATVENLGDVFNPNKSILKKIVDASNAQFKLNDLPNILGANILANAIPFSKVEITGEQDLTNGIARNGLTPLQRLGYQVLNDKLNLGLPSIHSFNNTEIKMQGLFCNPNSPTLTYRSTDGSTLMQIPANFEIGFMKKAGESGPELAFKTTGTKVYFESFVDYNLKKSDQNLDLRFRVNANLSEINSNLRDLNIFAGVELNNIKLISGDITSAKPIFTAGVKTSLASIFAK